METPCERAERHVRDSERLIVEQEVRIAELQRCDFYEALPDALIAYARMHRFQALALAELVDERAKLFGVLPLPGTVGI